MVDDDRCNTVKQPLVALYESGWRQSGLRLELASTLGTSSSSRRTVVEIRHDIHLQYISDDTRASRGQMILPLHLFR